MKNASKCSCDFICLHVCYTLLVMVSMIMSLIMVKQIPITTTTTPLPPPLHNGYAKRHTHTHTHTLTHTYTVQHHVVHSATYHVSQHLSSVRRRRRTGGSKVTHPDTGSNTHQHIHQGHGLNTGLLSLMSVRPVCRSNNNDTTASTNSPNDTQTPVSHCLQATQDHGQFSPRRAIQSTGVPFTDDVQRRLAIM